MLYLMCFSQRYSVTLQIAPHEKSIGLKWNFIHLIIMMRDSLFLKIKTSNTGCAMIQIQGKFNSALDRLLQDMPQHWLRVD